MNTSTMDDLETIVQERPGAQLAKARKEKGYSKDYVAGKLYLRVQLIDSLEADDYYNMPEPVFVKGYLRAYAKLLELSPEPLLDSFNSLYVPQRKNEKALWQSKRESNKAEHVIRWLTALFVIGAITAVGIWWYNNKDNEKIFPRHMSRHEPASNKAESKIRLTDLSKMRSLLSSTNQYSTVEKASD